MNDEMYIRLDNTGITVTSSRAEFDKKPVRLMETEPVIIGSRITMDSFYNFKFITLVMLLASAPFAFGIGDAFPSAEEVRAEREARVMKEVVKRCAKPNVDRVLVTTMGMTKTINCGEIS
jgi:hypothetical protein